MDPRPPTDDPPVTPRPAATVLLLRDGAAGLEVFMVVRHQRMTFGDALVFPGGRVDDADAALATDTMLCPPVPGVDAAAMAHRVAGLRECFEECGILLARAAGSRDLISPVRFEKYSYEIQEGALSFADFLGHHELILAADVLVPFAHWITPIVYPKRFDTQFFLAAAPPHHAGRHDGRESVDSCWITPQAAFADAAAGKCKLEFATRRNLEKLARQNSVQAAMAVAAAAPIVTVLPQVTESPEGLRTQIPAAADYGGEHFLMNA